MANLTFIGTLGSGGDLKDKTWAEAIAEVVSEMSGRTSGAVEIQATEEETPVSWHHVSTLIKAGI